MKDNKTTTAYDISVIILAYNAEQYLRECIDSVLDQTKKNIQIVIVNDGSADSTGRIIEGYREVHPNIKVISQENKGVRYARAVGFNHADGEYIGWVDSDDMADRYMFEKLYNLAESNQADCVYCDYEFYPEKVKNKGKWFKEYKGVIDGDFIDRNTQLWNKLVKRSLLEKISFSKLYPQISEYANIAILLNAEKIVYTNEKLYLYRVGQDSLSGGSIKGKVQHYKDGVIYTRRLKRLLLQGTKYEQSLKQYFDYRYIYTLFLLMIVSSYNEDKKTYLRARTALQKTHYRQNRYVRPLLDLYYGKAGSFVIRSLIPISYRGASIITKKVF